MIWRSFIAFFALILVAVGSSNVVVYEHHCKKDGSYYGFSASNNHDCAHETEGQCDLPKESCCSAVPEMPPGYPELGEECCSSSYIILQVDNQLPIQLSEVNITKSSANFSSLDPLFKALPGESCIPEIVPPDLHHSQRERRARLQIFLI